VPDSPVRLQRPSAATPTASPPFSRWDRPPPQFRVRACIGWYGGGWGVGEKAFANRAGIGAPHSVSWAITDADSPRSDPRNCCSAGAEITGGQLNADTAVAAPAILAANCAHAGRIDEPNGLRSRPWFQRCACVGPGLLHER
jgi:hypothetical protein